MKTAKITASKFSREWSPADNPDNVTYYHDIELDNGDTGSIGAKQKNPQTLAVDQILTYTIEESARGNKIKSVGGGKFTGGKGGYQREAFEEKAVGFAFSYAKDLTVAGKLEPGKKMIETANAIYDAMLATAKRGRV